VPLLVERASRQQLQALSVSRASSPRPA
jgi:hypothetical protein